LPDPHQGMWMDPRAFQFRLRYQLRIPLLSAPTPCRLCYDTMDIYGDHALHCGVGQGHSHTFRHHLVRDTVARLVRDVGFAAPIEPALPSVGRAPARRADLLLPSWEGGRDVYVDFTGASPFTRDRLGAYTGGLAAAQAAQAKDVQYSPAVRDSASRFTVLPFAWGTLGGLEPRAMSLLLRLQEHMRLTSLASDRLPSYSALCRVSYVIALGVGYCLSARF